MKKIVLGIIIVLFLALYGIAENHRYVDNQWGKWKELTLDGANTEEPGFCLYCYIRDKIRDYNEDPNNIYSKERVFPYLYYVEGYGYATFERYMWDDGFPDTIIVKFTRDGEFEMYVEAERRGILRKRLYGNAHKSGLRQCAYS